MLAAGEGRRLRPLTETIPKTLLPVNGDTTILDIALHNLAAAGITDVGIVVGYRAEAIRERQDALEARHGVRLSLIDNDKASEWNNAYSLWLARAVLAHGALVVNGDTVHPAGVEVEVLAARGRAGIVLALDERKTLGEEEMKVTLDGAGAMRRITKQMPPSDAHGEYIGITLVEPAAAAGLADALEATWRRDPGLYYEDGYQEYVDRGGTIGVTPIGTTEWVEVDDHRDLERAREIACRY